MVTLPEPGLYNRPLVEATRYRFARRLPAAYRAEVDAHRMPLAAYVHTGRWPVLPKRPQQFIARQQTGLELLDPPRQWVAGSTRGKPDRTCRPPLPARLDTLSRLRQSPW